MAFRVLWMTSLTILASLLDGYHCNAVSSYGISRDHHPQKMVEIIELMLSQKPNTSERRDFGIHKVPQDEAPGYEIFTTANRNHQEAKGKQKIKIFVEAENYDDGDMDMLPQESKTVAFIKPRAEKQNIFEVLPLSIETAGLNIDEYQQTNIQNYKGRLSVDDAESYPSKRQANSGTTQRPKQTVKTTVKVTQKPEEKSTTARRETVKTTTVTSSQPERGKTRQKEEYTQRPNSETIYEDVPKPSNYGLGSTVILTVNEELPLSSSQREPSYVDQTRPYKEPSSPKKEELSRPLTYEQDYLTTTQSLHRNPSGQSYVAPVEEEYIRPVQNQQEFSRPTSRPVSNPRKNQQQYDENYEKPYKEERPVYTKEVEESRPVYQREPEVARPQNQRRPAYESEHDDWVTEERPTSHLERPTYNERPEETRPQRGERPTDSSHTSHRPVRDNGYFGFPESYQPEGSAFSRPLQNEPARSFPASPCLQVFKYEGREPEEDRWYADVYVSTDEVLIGMRLDITLDRPADLLMNWIAEVKTKDNVHFTILSLKKRLVPGPAENVRIMVKFDKNKPVPYLQSINLNGRRICPARVYHAGTQTQRTTTRRPTYENPADLQTKRTTEYYQEGPKRSTPGYVDEYEQETRRTTHSHQLEQKRTTQYDRRTTESYEAQEGRRTTPRTTTEYYTRPNPNPNGYEETDYNDFNRPTTKKPTQSRPSSSNSKPTPQPQQRPSSSTNRNPTASSTTGSSKLIPCGKPSVQPRPLITNGQMTARGQWPWHVALYKNVGADLSYICGGSLISNQHVVTAAHCVTKTYDIKPLDANILVVYLGKYHLKLWSEGGVQNKQVSEVVVHPNYNSTDFRADLAVLVLSSPVEFTDFIRPVCLWDKRSTRIEDIEGKEGTVIGWGFDESKKLTEDLMQAKMPVIKHDTCLWSYPQFFPQFTSNLTYCAGFKNGTSVCNGDSGGGMFFPLNDNGGEQRWYIRGLVSISVKQKDSVLCDLKHYIVFTDLSKFTSWLNNFV